VHEHALKQRPLIGRVGRLSVDTDQPVAHTDIRSRVARAPSQEPGRRAEAVLRALHSDRSWTFRNRRSDPGRAAQAERPRSASPLRKIRQPRLRHTDAYVNRLLVRDEHRSGHDASELASSSSPEVTNVSAARLQVPHRRSSGTEEFIHPPGRILPLSLRSRTQLVPVGPGHRDLRPCRRSPAAANS
jgi:hypothetical protein